MKKKKIAIYYDTFIKGGAAQKVIVSLANELGADLIVSGFNKDLKKQLMIKGKVIDIGNFSIYRNYSVGSLIEAPIRYALSSKLNYDIHIFAGVYSIFSAKKGNTNIWFSFTPNRILYDLKDWKFMNGNIYQRLIYKLINFMFFNADQNIIKNNITKIISQTETIRKRIHKYYGINSDIIFSPVKTSEFAYNKMGNYYLAVSRLIPEKRMDVIARAFVKLKDKKLILIGSGPEESKIKVIIKNNKNIRLLTDINDQTLKHYYANCKAVIYIPVDEDFGLVPVEAMASGKCCIASNEGGCKETIINNKTGYLINSSEKDLIEVVNKIKDEDLLKMKENCINRSKMFDENIFISKWKTIVSKYN